MINEEILGLLRSLSGSISTNKRLPLKESPLGIEEKEEENRTVHGNVDGNENPAGGHGFHHAGVDGEGPIPEQSEASAGVAKTNEGSEPQQVLEGTRALNQNSSSFEDAHHNHTMSEADLGGHKATGPSGNSAEMVLEVRSLVDVE